MKIYLLNCMSGDYFSNYETTHTINAYYLREEVEEVKKSLEESYDEIKQLELYLNCEENINRCATYELCRLTGTPWSRWFIWYGVWKSYTIDEIELI